ncbi:scavenger mRNA decapping enzyme [Boletus edulis BED1]|uniref:Scavenger mRNA decapping enzyme n=1 Tax=Boletus edulis BED1 TaxID=1328754 RepID=A0AAD4GD31_BOLED|nr:scavenger mRNA decapping enzyme [Boletus edulis BED1]
MDSSSSNTIPFPYDLDAFAFERILDESPNFHFLIVLGTFPVSQSTFNDNNSDANSTGPSAGTQTSVTRLPAILRIERTAFSPTFADRLSTGIVASTKRIGHTDIYAWWHGWLAHKVVEDMPDVMIRVIFPATEVHIRKYTKQEQIMVTETPELYRTVVTPYMDAFPASRTQWVRDVLDGTAEADAVLCRTPHFLIMPDMKWDPNGPISSLYLLAIVADPTLRSLRDLRGGPNAHIDLLEEIREKAYDVVEVRWGLPKGALRMYVHYQPSYYHFHVHIVHASQNGMMGMAVGQAHLLEDIISMLKHSPNILAELTLTYGLGSQHGLYDAMVAIQADTEQADQ